MTFSVRYIQNALSPQMEAVETLVGSSLAVLAPTWDTPFICLVNGEPVLRAEWELVPETGSAVVFVDVNAIPQGGNGSSNPIAVILMIVVMVYAPYMASAMYGAMGGTMVAANAGMVIGAMTAGITVAGMALISAVIPPPQPTSPQSAAALAAASPTYNVQAQGNTARLDAAIPEHFGRMLAYPDFAAMPYQEYSGNDQYVFQLLCIGRGEYDIESIRIEDTDISSFSDITTEIILPNLVPTLFPSDVVSSIEVSGQELGTDMIGPFICNPSGTVTARIGVDMIAPRGLYYAMDTGDIAEQTITVLFEASLVSELGAYIGGWFTLGSVSHTGATTTPQRYSENFVVPSGRYAVRAIRVGSENSGSRYGHKVSWGGLRAYLSNNHTFGDVTLLALRMKATNSLSSLSSRKVNVIATRKLPQWTGAAWSALAPTRSIAWATAYICKQAGMSDNDIDLSSLSYLDSVWSSRGDYFDARFDGFISFWEALTKVLATGRAKPYMQGGLVRFVRDQHQSTPVALFSMRNIVKGSFSVDYLMPTAETADAVRVGYFDNTTWAAARVPASLSISTAVKPVNVDFFGITDREHAHREGLYLAATNRYRRKHITFTTEMEGFIPSIGDLIAIQHDMPAWGQGGEVTGWTYATKTLTLSNEPQWLGGSSYIGLRKRDGSVDGPYLVTPGPQPDQVVLSVYPSITPYIGGNEERTHYAFGGSETWRLAAKVLSVRAKSHTQVQLDCVNEDESVHTADQGVVTPPIITSQLANYTPRPVVKGISVTPVLYHPDQLIVTWEPTPWANNYIIEQSYDGVTWTGVGRTGSTSITVQALYGATSLIRVAAVGAEQGPWASNIEVAIDRTPPPASPTATVSGGLFSIDVVWAFGDARTTVKGTEVWWSPVDSRASASRISFEPFPVTSYKHVGLAPGFNGYYWVRVIDTSDVASIWFPISDTGGLYGITSTDTTSLLTQLNGAIGASQLATSLATPIATIPSLGLAVATMEGTTLPAYGNRIDNAETSISDGLNSEVATWQSLNAWAPTLLGSVATNFASIDNIQTTKIGYSTLNSTGELFDNNGVIVDGDGVTAWNTANPTNTATWNIGMPLAQAIRRLRITTSGGTAALEEKFQVQALTNDGLLAQYVLKIDVNGRVTGIALANGTDGGSFTILADKFVIAQPSSYGSTLPPLTMVTVGTINGVTALGVNGNIIADGTVSGRAFNATGRITSGTGNNVAIIDGSQAGYRLWAGNATPSLAPFSVSDTGSVMIKSVSGLAKVEISNAVIKVFDTSGVKRVQIGDLSL